MIQFLHKAAESFRTPDTPYKNQFELMNLLSGIDILRSLMKYISETTASASVQKVPTLHRIDDLSFGVSLIESTF